MRYAISSFLVVLFLLPALAQRNAKIPDPDPEIERRSFKVADGFEVNLYASDPLLKKPIQMNFDAAGRLWVASSEAYPQIKPGQKANDKILVLEDTRGAGKADRVTVFADGLLIPTGLEPGHGGVYVANSTEILHLADTDGDGKADKRRIVLSGFGTEDTHHIIHTFRWGHDGNLYFNQSVYIHSHVETPHGVRRLNAGGIWQLRPQSLRLEVYTRGLWNTWGHHFDRFGQSFLTDGAGTQGVAHGFPGAAYAPLPTPSRTLEGMNPGHPKYCGLEIVSGRHLPDDWQGNLITCDFRAHRVCRFVLAPSGSGYTARLMPDVIKASHPAFRPIDVKMGPDGAIYVADWYNPIIQHGEVDFRDPRRDVTHGRIWRITARGRPLVARPRLREAKPADLVKHLEAPEAWTRHFARRVLEERGAREASATLAAWVAKRDPGKSEHEPHLLEALWTYQTLDVVEPRLLNTLLDAKDHRVRAAAVRVLSAWHDRIEGVTGLLEKRISDEQPLVRLEAVRALAQVPSPRSAELALRALERPLDVNLDFALWLTLRELEPVWLPALQAGKLDFGGDVRRLAFALQAVGSEKVVRPLLALVQGGKLPADSADGVLALLAGVGGPGELALVLARATEAKAPATRQAQLLAALEESARQRGVLPAGDRKAIVALIDSPEERVQAPAARLAGLWGVAQARDKLVSLARDEKASVSRRRSAIEGLAALGGAASKETLVALAEKGSPEARRAAVVALTGLDLGLAASSLPGVLEASKDGEGVADLFAAFLERKGGAALLAKTLAGGKLPADVARVGVRAVRTSGRPAPGLAEVLAKAGGLTTGPRILSADEMRSLVADVATRGDASRGEKVFRRVDQLCLKCHAIGGAGGQVGPDLSSLGASVQVDYLFDSLLQPSKAIKENYHATLVTTVKGQQFTGIKVRQTKTAVILRNDQDREVVIPLKDVEEQVSSKVSLMPEGLTDTLTRGELVDLVRFLSELGKGDRWSVGRQKVARRWQVLQPTSEVSRVLNRIGMNGLVGQERALTWEPAYGTVAGLLPVADLARFHAGKGGPAFSLARTQLDAQSASKVRLRLNESKGVTLWLDGEPVLAAREMTLELKPGLHLLTLAVKHGEAAETLRLEVEDTPTAAGVRFVGGK